MLESEKGFRREDGLKKRTSAWVRLLPHRALEKKPLLFLQLVDAALDGIFDNEAPHLHWAILPQPMDAVHSLVGGERAEGGEVDVSHPGAKNATQAHHGGSVYPKAPETLQRGSTRGP